MKVTVTVILMLLLSVSTANAGYEIRSHTIDGGGGTSAGGQFIVTGTIAQHDAGYSSSDDFELLGGFWPGQPSCFVDFEHFARFANYWLETGDNLPADLYVDEDNTVNNLDLNEFVAQWLWYCPYNWPLR